MPHKQGCLHSWSHAQDKGDSRNDELEDPFGYMVFREPGHPRQMQGLEDAVLPHEPVFFLGSDE